MANCNHPFGMRPLCRTESGGAPDVRAYQKAAVNSLPIYKWDPVILDSGKLHGPANGIRPGATRYLGVALGSTVVTTSMRSDRASSAEDILLVEVSPDSLFEIQGDSSESGETEISANTINLSANLNLSGVAGGGTLGDDSGVQLDESTIALNSTLDVTVLSLPTYGQNGRCEVRFNKHLLKHPSRD
jgi:hypothetical protein